MADPNRSKPTVAASEAPSEVPSGAMALPSLVPPLAPSRRLILGVAGGALLSGVMLSAPGVRAQVPGGPGGPGGRRDPAQFREQMKAQLKELLGSTDDEWKILEPKIDKVQELQQVNGAARGMGMMRLMFNRGGPGGPGGPGGAGGRFNRDQGPPATVQLKWQELQNVIESKEASPDRYKAALAAFREARAQAQADLLKAQNELRDLLTPRQEAILVALGMID